MIFKNAIIIFKHTNFDPFLLIDELIIDPQKGMKK